MFSRHVFILNPTTYGGVYFNITSRKTQSQQRRDMALARDGAIRKRSECYASEEPVVIVGIKKIHQLNIDVVF